MFATIETSLNLRRCLRLDRNISFTTRLFLSEHFSVGWVCALPSTTLVRKINLLHGWSGTCVGMCIHIWENNNEQNAQAVICRLLSRTSWND